MVSINYAFKEISCKIVYYGPGLSGKTTNLQYVHKKVPQPTKGELISLATDADRTLYFDFLPINIGSVAGFTTKFQLYTVPGQVYYNATRKLVLRGVDGLVFVADSQESKMEENVESLKNLLDNLQEYGYSLNEVPMVIQYNKRDLPGALPLDVLEKALNPNGLPSFEAVAVKGDGVFDTLKCIIKIVLEKARAKSETGSKASETAPAPMSEPASPPARQSILEPVENSSEGRPTPPPRPKMEPVGVQSDWSVPTASEQFRPVPGLSKPTSAPASMEGHRPVVVPGVRQTSGSEVEQRNRPSLERKPLAPAERLSAGRSGLDLKNRPVLRPSELARGRKEEKKKGFFSRLFGLFKK
jgi:signal recognition particle receptor subunit beta